MSAAHGGPSVARSAPPASPSFLADVLDGLAASPKRVSPKYLYDREGSRLFDAICELPEYYLTRTELAIMRAHAEDLARLATRDGSTRVCVLEPGAGSGAKTRILLRALGAAHCAGYAPVDISREHLEASAERLRAELPWLRVTPACADFTLALPGGDPSTGDADRGARRLVYFPGSTIGNFEPPEVARLLARFARAAGPAGLVVVGVDVETDPVALHAAYNDARGVTAAFNKNLLVRMDRELGADFDPDAFAHYAFYQPVLGRIEMHLVSQTRQVVTVAGHRFAFEAGESVHTESSYKWDLRALERTARGANLALRDVYVDDRRRFAVLAFTSPFAGHGQGS